MGQILFVGQFSSKNVSFKFNFFSTLYYFSEQLETERIVQNYVKLNQ